MSKDEKDTIEELKIDAWSIGTRVYQRLAADRVMYATVTDVTPHESWNPWVCIESDNGGQTAGTQTTLMECGIKPLEE